MTTPVQSPMTSAGLRGVCVALAIMVAFGAIGVVLTLRYSLVWGVAAVAVGLVVMRIYRHWRRR